MPLSEKEVKPDSGFLGFLVAVYVVAFAGYLGLRRGVAAWYGGLLHPNAALPAWAFGPIWAMLCLLLGYVGWRLWTAERSRIRNVAMGLFAGQLVLHSAWAWLLFGLQKPLGSLVVIGVLGAVALVSFFVAHRVRPITAVLVTPFLAWIFYATFLNYGLWSLNYRSVNGIGVIETTESRD